VYSGEILLCHDGHQIAVVILTRRTHHAAVLIIQRRHAVSNQSIWETLKGDSQAIIERLKTLIHEGNVRRVVVQHEGRTIAEFPVTAGVIGALLAPLLAAIGAIFALLKDCTIKVEKNKPDAKAEPPRAAAG
jgi:hypothetical protein